MSGDLIDVTLTREVGRSSRCVGEHKVLNRLCVVRQVDIDWQTSTVRVTAYHYSESA